MNISNLGDLLRAAVFRLRQRSHVPTVRKCRQLLAGEAPGEGVELDAATTPLVQ